MSENTYVPHSKLKYTIWIYLVAKKQTKQTNKKPVKSG